MSREVIIRVFTEKSKSRRGLHQRRRLYFVVNKACEELKFSITHKNTSKTMYAKGEAEEHYIIIPKDGYAVQLDFRVNPRGVIVGEVLIYNHEGVRIGRAVYRKLKVRLIEGPSEVVEIIKCVFRKLKLPVKRYAVIKSKQ